MRNILSGEMSRKKSIALTAQAIGKNRKETIMSGDTTQYQNGHLERSNSHGNAT